MQDSNASLRHSIYGLLIAIAFGMITGHIIGVETGSKATAQPTHSDNDRSRWATVRALVEENTYAIGVRVYLDEEEKDCVDIGQLKESGWGTIDKVLKPDIAWINPNPQPGEPLKARFYYSSKPPLLPTILAGEYWVMNKLFGWNMTNDGRFPVVRIILFSINGLPWLIALILMAKLIDQLGTSDFGRLAAVAAACFCTFVNAFANTLNNHTIAAWSVIFALYPVLNAVLQQRPVSFWGALLSGFFTGWTVANELPALAFAGLLFLWLVFRQPRALIPFMIGAALPLAGFLLTNYLAIGTMVPAYDKFGTEWYNYPGSFWNPENIKGIDKPKDSTLIYLFHLTFGHHGLFSLTPILLISLISFVLPGISQAETRLAQIRKSVGWLTLLLSLVVLGFYLTKTESYNYGGWTAGPRWFIWLTPLWILGALPMLDVLSTARWGRITTMIALGWSAMSVAFPMYTPWRHPWLYRILEHWGVIDYESH